MKATNMGFAVKSANLTGNGNHELTLELVVRTDGTYQAHGHERRHNWRPLYASLVWGESSRGWSCPAFEAHLRLDLNHEEKIEFLKKLVALPGADDAFFQPAAFRAAALAAGMSELVLDKRISEYVPAGEVVDLTWRPFYIPREVFVPHEIFGDDYPWGIGVALAPDVAAARTYFNDELGRLRQPTWLAKWLDADEPVKEDHYSAAPDLPDWNAISAPPWLEVKEPEPPAPADA
jgi:hypothetical protein